MPNKIGCWFKSLIAQSRECIVVVAIRLFFVWFVLFSPLLLQQNNKPKGNTEKSNKPKKKTLDLDQPWLRWWENTVITTLFLSLLAIDPHGVNLSLFLTVQYHKLKIKKLFFFICMCAMCYVQRCIEQECCEYELFDTLDHNKDAVRRDIHLVLFMAHILQKNRNYVDYYKNVVESIVWRGNCFEAIYRRRIEILSLENQRRNFEFTWELFRRYWWRLYQGDRRWIAHRNFQILLLSMETPDPHSPDII